MLQQNSGFITRILLLFLLVSATFKGNAQHTINAVLGDVSWQTLQPKKLLSETSETERISTHLQYVIGLLKRELRGFSSTQLQNRRHCLQLLSTYINEARFPKNRAYPGERRPCFIDGDRICAVGYLVAKTAGLAEAQRVNQRYQYEYVLNMKDEGLNRWAEKWGFSLRELAMIQPTYDFEYPTPKFEADVYFDEKTNKVGLQSKEGKKITSARFDMVTPLLISNKLAIASVNDKYGLINAKGEWQVNPTYDIIGERGGFPENRGTHLTAYKGKKITLLNHLGKPINNEPIDRVVFTEDNYFVAERNGKWGALSYDGKMVIPFEYKSIQPHLYYASFAVKGENGHGLMARWGDTLIEPVYDTLTFMKKSWFATKNGKGFLFDTYGKPSVLKGIDACYTYAYGYRDNNLLCKKNGRYGVIDAKHEWLIKPQYDTIIKYGRYHSVFKGSNQGFCNMQGELVIPVSYETIEQRGHNFIVSNQGKKGLMNKEYRIAIPLKYDSLQHIGYALEGITQLHCYAALAGNHWKLVNDQGKAQSEKEFDEVKRLNAMYFFARKDEEVFVGNYAKKEVQLQSTLEYEKLELVFGEYLSYRNEGKYGLLITNGTITQEPLKKVTRDIYEEPLRSAQMVNGYIVAKRKGKYGVIDRYANTTMPFNYLEYRCVPKANNNARFIYLRNEKGWFEAYANGHLKPLTEDSLPR